MQSLYGRHLGSCLGLHHCSTDSSDFKKRCKCVLFRDQSAISVNKLNADVRSIHTLLAIFSPCREGLQCSPGFTSQGVGCVSGTTPTRTTVTVGAMYGHAARDFAVLTFVCLLSFPFSCVQIKTIHVLDVSLMEVLTLVL